MQLDPLFKFSFWNVISLDIVDDIVLMWQWSDLSDAFQLHHKVPVVQLHQGSPFIATFFGP